MSRARTRQARKRSRRRSPRRVTLFFLKHLLLWGLLALSALCLWLDATVANTFESRQWSLPSRVFSRHLRLYEGALIDPERLVRELEALHYRAVSEPAREGQYRVTGQHIEIFLRGFDFGNDRQAPRRIDIEFQRGRIASLRGHESQALAGMIRLEPVELGLISSNAFEDRLPLRFDELSPAFVNALLIVEDRRFFLHPGFDIFGLLRAAWLNLVRGGWSQGGSTLTQQLVKNLYLTRERTLSRKFIELLMAVSLDLRYDKKKILETYVNEVYLGQDGRRALHGFGIAAEFYFQKPLRELDVAEAALLIGLVKGPSLYNPIRHPENALRRRELVLSVLTAAGAISEADAALARNKKLPTAGGRRSASGRPMGVLDAVKRELSRDFKPDNLRTAGLRVFTSVDPLLQAGVQGALSSRLASVEPADQKGKLQAAMVVLEPSTGQVLALTGDRNPGYAGFNRALDARRQVGSLIKPFIYALALSEPGEYSLVSPLMDVAVQWSDRAGEGWRPENFDRQQHGRILLLDALVRSMNLATVNLVLDLGVKRVAAFLQKILQEPVSPVPAIALGAVELTPLEVAQAYTIFANAGIVTTPHVITAVTDRDGNELTRYAINAHQAISQESAALVRYALSQVVQRGTARSLSGAFEALPLAGKTGTTNDLRDAWFAGFGGNLLAVVWIGRDDNAPIGLTGSSGALRVWIAALREAGLSGLDAQLPDALGWRLVDMESGGEISKGCQSRTGTLVPVHIESQIPSAPGCRTEALKEEKSPSLLKRLRRFFW